MEFDLNGHWRVSRINNEFKLCSSYPRLFLVPTNVTDKALQEVASFRSSRRIPIAVWRHKKSGAIIARCSQPEVGWLGWRNKDDEELLQAIVEVCTSDSKELQQQQNGSLNLNAEHGKTHGSGVRNANKSEGKLLIVDARSYTSAVTNRARGGGCESIDYYPCAEIQFMSLANIHSIRGSFSRLRQLCASPSDINSWLSNLEKTQWLQNLSSLLSASAVVCEAIEKCGRPVLVHCSDGWDRTPQIVATAQLCLDPHYRTVEGFKMLVEREWLSFGHKFGDRCGHGPHSHDLNERCPVFLQWLDIVHQIHVQFPCSFEFNMGYLVSCCC